MKILIGIIVLLITININQACVINGKIYENGETWIEKNFELECNTKIDGSWRTRITACLAPGGFRLLVGTEFIEAGMRYSCTRKPDGRVEFAYGPA
uniref:Abnormal cell migration protein 18-like fibronectin type I domain-containing protein n=1 Tax=Wuchereria bancrofti TaxID=6293 RepID=A0AAF5PYQ8_WUCBA